MKYKYLSWYDVPYAGEESPPANPVETSAGTWSLYYLNRGVGGEFYDPFGKRLRLPIKDPREIDWNKELQDVKNTLSNLTPAQRKIAIYYGAGVPTKQWTPVIDRLIDTYGVTPPRAARIIAAVQAAINDTMIVVWYLKYKWAVARPNQFDRTMETTICTPRFPAYPSGHSSMSGCSEVVLSYFFPGERENLHKLANENALSRLYGGIHFPADNDEGLILGRYIGSVIVNYLKKQREPNLKPIDQPYKKNLNADVYPIDYQQFIPYSFPSNCTSLVKPSSGQPNLTKNISKPKLFF